jgi:hypothetical protein
MKTVFGMAMNQDGLSGGQEIEQGRDGPELRYRAWSTSVAEMRHVQPARIPIDTTHDEHWIGERVYMERDRQGRLSAVGHANIDPPEWQLPLFWSPKTNSLQNDVIVEAIALTPWPRQIGLRQHLLTISPAHWIIAVPLTAGAATSTRPA